MYRWTHRLDTRAEHNIYRYLYVWTCEDRESKLKKQNKKKNQQKNCD
jgi:hypothetical protein